MTLVCVRLDSSFRTPRLTALADTRASTHRSDGSWKTISDSTVKLFAIPVRCYGADTLTPVIGAWNDPYFETLIGFGFSGSCFEALTVIAHLTQSLSALIAPHGDRPVPCKDGLVHLIAKITEAYFKNHSLDGDPILQMLVFGFNSQRPWIGKVNWDAKAKIKWSAEWAAVDTLETIGQDALFAQYANEWRRRIQRHRADVRAAENGAASEDAAFKRDLALAHHDIADKKIAEEEMLRQIELEFAADIGGVLQRLELGLDGEHVVAGFTQDDRPYLDGASYTVARGTLLGPIPIVEKMGRQVRKPTTRDPS